MEGTERGGIPWKDRPFDKCGISVAAKSNGNGTWCDGCLRASEAQLERDWKEFSDKVQVP